MSIDMIKEAEKATDVIIENWNKAYQQLEHGVDYNGYCVLYDPSRTLDKLLTARGAIDAALKAHRATTWLSQRDYDQAEQQEREEREERERQESGEWA